MRNFYTMKNLVKGLMLCAVMTLGVATASAQEAGNGDVKPATPTDFWMGETAKAGEFYLYNVGAKIFATATNNSTEDYTKASAWTLKSSKSSYSFTSGKSKIYLGYNRYTALSGWVAEISTSRSATDMSLVASSKTKDKGNCYKLSKTIWPDTRYFNVEKPAYSAAKTESEFNDWLFISDAQKKAYDEYVKLFNKAKSYTEAGSKLLKSDDKDKTNAIVKQINDALKSYNYISYEKENGGKAKLEAAIKAAEDFINATTGINEIGSTTDAKVSEIYGVNGARKSQLTKGLNIVKMSDGTVKKVLVK